MIFCHIFRYLDLQDNCLSDFEDICHLSSLPKLQHLLICDNGLTSVVLPACEPNERPANLFPAMTQLNIQGNPFNDELATFNELDKLPKLENLFVTVNPASGYEAMFSDCVARIGQLKMLNKVLITAADRRGAEYDIWKKYGHEWTMGNDVQRKQLTHQCRVYPNLVASKKKRRNCCNSTNINV